MKTILALDNDPIAMDFLRHILTQYNLMPRSRTARRLAGLEETKKAALQMGSLRQAENNAMTSIRSLLGLVGVKRVVFVPGSASLGTAGSHPPATPANDAGRPIVNC